MEAEPRYDQAKLEHASKAEEEDLYNKLQELNKQL